MSLTESSYPFDPPFVILQPPVRSTAFVFNAPHAGSVYPDEMLRASQLAPSALRRSEDAFVDGLFAGVVALGAPLMAARFPRAWLDVNREPYELDPAMFDAPLPAYANTRSMRVAGGLGTIPRIVANGQDIYRGRLRVAEAMRRIETLYKPYHRALRGLLSDTFDRFGHSVLVDCHSMPSASHGRDDSVKADMVLGDRYGTSCAGLLTDLVHASFRARGYAVVRNKPYAGGFITEHYGSPAFGRHALQVEVNRALYMNERALKPLPSFGALATDIAAVFADVMGELGQGLDPIPMAAE